MSKEIEENIKEIEQAKSNILRGIDIESSALILEKAILDGYIFTGGRIDTLKLATRQILYFIENSKVRNNIGDKDILDYVKENVKLKEDNEDNKKTIKELKEENIQLMKLKENYGYSVDVVRQNTKLKYELFNSIPKAKIIEEKGARKHIMEEYKKKWIHKDEKYYKTEIEFNLLQELLKDGRE